MAFQPGQSGNPSGRPKGRRDRRTIFREMIEPSGPKLVDKAVKMALNGNEQMLKLLLERLLPPKPQEEIMDISLKSGSLVEQSKQLIQEVANGNISIDEGHRLMQTLAIQAKIYESGDLKAKIEELEKMISYHNK